MPKRILILFCVALLLGLMVVPAFAITTSTPPSTGVASAGIKFDTISYNAAQPSGHVDDQIKGIASWPFNEAGRNVGAEVNMFVPESTYFPFIACVEPASNCVSGWFGLKFSGYFELSARQMFFSDRSTLTIGGYGDDGPSGFSKVIVSYEVLTLEQGTAGMMYVPTSKSIYYDSSSDGFVLPSQLDIGDLITRAYAFSTGEVFSGDPGLLSNVSIKVYYADRAGGSGACFSVYATSQNEGSFFSWAEEQNLIMATDKTWYDWLLESVSAFLDFEIAPGFSFNKLFWVVLVIIVIFAFAKIIR